VFKKNISDGVGSRNGSNGTPLGPPLFWLDNIFNDNLKRKGSTGKRRKNATVCRCTIVHTVSPIRIIRECTSNERTGKHYIYVWHNKGMYGTSFLLVYTPRSDLLIIYHICVDHKEPFCRPEASRPSHN
jgi:hypothetical protein